MRTAVLILVALALASLSAAQSAIKDSVANYAILRGDQMVGQHQTSTSHIVFEASEVIYIEQTTKMFGADGSGDTETMLQTWIKPNGQPVKASQTLLLDGMRDRSTAQFNENGVWLTNTAGNSHFVKIADTKGVFGSSIQPLIQDGNVVRERREFYSLNFRDGSLIKGELTFAGEKAIDVCGTTLHVREVDSSVARQVTRTYVGDDGSPVMIDLGNGLVMIPN